MKNSLGNPARGEAFYDRSTEIRKVYRVLATGTSIYLSAPRRVGKTSILKYLEEFPENDFRFIYIITESSDNENEFFNRVFNEVIASEAINHFSKMAHGIKDLVSGLLSRIKSVYHIELKDGDKPDYYELLVELLTKLTPECGKLVIMIDEFPQTIENILEKDGKGAAEHFIQKNRELRHHKNIQDKVSFIYTGSVSLFPMVEKVTSLTAINDLRTVAVEPLSPDDAMNFLALLMATDQIPLSEDLQHYVIEKIVWLIPFHLQLIQQELVDVYESTGMAIDRDAVDRAFEQIVRSRNKPQFEPYFSRLRKIFKDHEYPFVKEVLEHIAINNTIGPDELYNMSIKHRVADLKYMMDILEGDGYLLITNKTYQYTSPILQLWCKKHICQ